MSQVYKFTVTMPVNDTLPRNRISNTVHLQHVTGGLPDTALEQMCSDMMAMYQARYANLTKEIQVTAYDTDAVPNYPRARTTVNAGAFWTCTMPPEVALVMSFAGANRGNKRERGRIYLMPQISSATNIGTLRPSSVAMGWALDFYRVSNASFPDLGGVDWKFGVWSKTANAFTQAQQAWVNDDWDHIGKRTTRESTRLSATREG